MHLAHALRAFPDWLAWQIPTATCPIVGDVVDSAAGAFWPGLRRKAGDPRGCNSTRPDPGTVGAAVLHPEPGLQTRMEGGRHVAVTLVRGSHARSGTSGGGLLTPPIQLFLCSGAPSSDVQFPRLWVQLYTTACKFAYKLAVAAHPTAYPCLLLPTDWLQQPAFNLVIVSASAHICPKFDNSHPPMPAVVYNLTTATCHRLLRRTIGQQPSTSAYNLPTTGEQPATNAHNLATSTLPCLQLYKLATATNHCLQPAYNPPTTCLQLPTRAYNLPTTRLQPAYSYPPVPTTCLQPAYNLPTATHPCLQPAYNLPTATHPCLQPAYNLPTATCPCLQPANKLPSICPHPAQSYVSLLHHRYLRSPTIYPQLCSVCP